MSKKNTITRWSERVGWMVSLSTFVCGAGIVYEYQECRHREQMEEFVRAAQMTKPTYIQKQAAAVEVSSKTLPPTGSEIGHAFWVQQQYEVMRTEVTEDLYRRVVQGVRGGPSIPQLFSSVQEAKTFADALSVHQGFSPCYQSKILVDCTGWRIPLHNEWMLFASAGQGTAYAGSDVFSDVGWRTKTYIVASKPPNKWGMYDMSGGVKELVQDQGEDQFGLLGEEENLQKMKVQPLNERFAIRLIRISQDESNRVQ